VISDERVALLAADLVAVDGVVGVTLGGSRARGTHLPGSDVDLGVYVDRDVDLASLQALADRRSSAPVVVSGFGGWGPWVEGGAWLTVDGTAVDWILRDVDRVSDQVARARRGSFAFHQQLGHPIGFLDVSYAGEVALGLPLADPEERLTELRAEVTPYPPALGDALAGLTGDARFLVGSATKGAGRGDTTYVAQCLSQAVLLACHALHGRARRWVLNEKGLVDATAALPGVPADFAVLAQSVTAHLGTDPESLRAACTTASALLDSCA
jgi:hypothetical protein